MNEGRFTLVLLKHMNKQGNVDVSTPGLDAVKEHVLPRGQGAPMAKERPKGSLSEPRKFRPVVGVLNIPLHGIGMGKGVKIEAPWIIA